MPKITKTQHVRISGEALRALTKRYGHVIGTYDDVKNDQHLTEGSNQTKEQQNRDGQISRLLKIYVEAYEAKVESNKGYKFCLYLVSMMTFCALIAACVYAIFCTVHKNTIEVTDAIALITVCVTVLGSVSFLLDIIARYIFPQNEETNITEIVKAIQANDLEDKRINIEAQEWRKIAKSVQRGISQEESKESGI